MRDGLLTYSYLCIILSLAGCGDEAVTGTLIDTHVTDTGDVQRIHDASTASVAVEVTGDDGTVTRIEGTVAKDGTFVVPDVPEGPYRIESTATRIDGTTYSFDYLTSVRSLDLGGVHAGRPNVALLKKQTPLEIQLDGLLPGGLNAQDELWFVSAGAGIACDFSLLGDTTAYITTNLRECGNLDETAPAIDATKGDRTFVTHHVKHVATPADPLSEYYHSVDKVFEPASFTVVDGEPASIVGTFSDVPQKTLTVSMDKDAFVATAVDVHPNAKLSGFTLSVLSDVGGPARRTLGNTHQTLLHYSTLNLDNALTEFQFGNPFPKEWSEHYLATVSYRVALEVPGAGSVIVTYASIGRSGPTASLSSTTFEPTMTPPRDIRVNGQPAAKGLSGVGTTPTISWSAPSKGTATGYEVLIYELDPTSSNYRSIVESITTSETSWTLPPKTFESGGYYYVGVRAKTSFNPQAPLKGDHWEQAFAEGLTGIIEP